MYSVLNSLIRKVLPSWIYTRVIGRWNSEGLRRYTSNTLWALGARTFNTVTSFFVTVALIRYLGPDSYGSLSYAISFIGLFGIVATLGIDNILYRDLVQHPEKRNVYLGTAFGIRVGAGLLAGLLAIVVGFIANPHDVSHLVIFLLAGTFVLSSFKVIINEFQALVAQKYPSLVTVAIVVILNVLKIGVIIAGEGILYIAIILLLEQVLYAVFLSYLRVRHYGSLRAWRFDSRVARQLLYDAWPFIFIGIFMTVYSYIDQIMLKHLIDSAAVGVYDAALRIAQVWLFVPAIVASALFPAIVHAKQTSVHEYRTRLLTLVSIFVVAAVCIALPLSLLAAPIIHLIYGGAFTGSIIVFAIYIWVSVWAVIDIVARHFLIVENMRKTIFWITIGTAVLNTVLNLILIPALGPAGAAWSTFISYALFALPLIKIIRMKDGVGEPSPRHA